MRLGVVSDPHGNVLGLQAALDALDSADTQSTVCAGDIVGYYPYVNETIELLRRKEVVCIAGNHDRYLRGDCATTPEKWQAYQLDYVARVISPTNREWLHSLPISLELEVDGARIFLCHGSPWSSEEYVYPQRADFERFLEIRADTVLMGHTHIPFVKRVTSPSHQVLLFNPGSCGQPRDYNPLAAYGVLDTRTKAVEFGRVAYDVEAVKLRCAELGFSNAVRDILSRTK